MLPECLIWIPHLWNRLICSLNIQKGGFSMGNLPEDILVDILSRLPGDRVLEFRRVSKQWLELTSTPNFVEMHLKRATPVLFVQNFFSPDLELFIFDKGARADHMLMKIVFAKGAKADHIGEKLMHLNPPYMPRIFGSCNGLLLFYTPSSKLCFVCNPLTRENVTIRFPVQGLVCGFFYHHLSKDYRLLLVSNKGIRFQYFIYSLGGCWWRIVDESSHRPGPYINPIILNGALHWMGERVCRNINYFSPCNNSIMIFDMIAEKCRSMPHPGRECSSRNEHAHAYLFEMKGKLAFCFVSSRSVKVTILEDYENWFWVPRYVVDLDTEGYPFNSCTWWPPNLRHSPIYLVDIQNNELLFVWRSRGLFSYNLPQKTGKQISGVGMKKAPNLEVFTYGRDFILYTKTFDSPRSFTSP